MRVRGPWDNHPLLYKEMKTTSQIFFLFFLVVTKNSTVKSWYHFSWLLYIIQHAAFAAFLAFGFGAVKVKKKCFRL